MFAQENFAHKFNQELVTVINSRPLQKLTIRQMFKHHHNFDHAWNHINERSSMTIMTTSGNNRGVFSVIHNFLFGPTGSQVDKQRKKNVLILMQNQLCNIT